MTNGKLTGKQAIEQVLKGKRAMRVADICAAAIPLSTLKGKTPAQTLNAMLYTEAKKEGGLVVQVERGTFKLNPKRVDPKAAKEKAKAATAKKATKAKVAKPEVEAVPEVEAEVVEVAPEVEVEA